MMVPRSLLLLLCCCVTRFHAQDTNNTDLVDAERERCGEIIDMHLHPSNYTSVDPLLVQMDEAGVSQGIVYSVYASNNTMLPDANTQVQTMIEESNGRMYGLASLDTSGDWNATRANELSSLLQYMEMDGFVGAKLAPPHTCLELNGTILPEVLQAVSNSAKPIVAIHTGTTPFCGIFGEIILGYRVSVVFCCR
jgi:hypothetical protein